MGGYGVAIRTNLKDSPELPDGPPDPAWLLARALDAPQAVVDAFRVLVWGYASEVVTWLWPDEWVDVREVIEELLRVDSAPEARVLEAAPADPDLSAEAFELEQADYCRVLLAAMAEAASGEEITDANPWLRIGSATWSDFYVEGQDTAAQLLGQLAPEGMPKAERPYRPPR